MVRIATVRTRDAAPVSSPLVCSFQVSYRAQANTLLRTLTLIIIQHIWDFRAKLFLHGIAAVLSHGLFVAKGFSTISLLPFLSLVRHVPPPV